MELARFEELVLIGVLGLGLLMVLKRSGSAPLPDIQVSIPALELPSLPELQLPELVLPELKPVQSLQLPSLQLPVLEGFELPSMQMVQEPLLKIKSSIETPVKKVSLPKPVLPELPALPDLSKPVSQAKKGVDVLGLALRDLSFVGKHVAGIGFMLLDMVKAPINLASILATGKEVVPLSFPSLKAGGFFGG